MEANMTHLVFTAFFISMIVSITLLLSGPPLAFGLRTTMVT